MHMSASETAGIFRSRNGCHTDYTGKPTFLFQQKLVKKNRPSFGPLLYRLKRERSFDLFPPRSRQERYALAMPEVRIAFLGDVVGKPGRRVVQQQLLRLREDHRPHMVIANGENIRAGSGITPEHLATLRSWGIDAVTLGDHVYRDQRIIRDLEDPAKPIARPANLSSRAPGKRFIRIAPREGRTKPVYVLAVLGRIFFPLPADDPFACIDRFLETSSEPEAITIVEAHMEATSEKIALAMHLRGRVAAVIGTHTHVPTADARVLEGGTAFITDLGMCGPYESIIGRDADAVLTHMTTGRHVPYAVAEGDARLCGAVVRIDEGTRRALSIERIEYRAETDKPPFI